MASARLVAVLLLSAAAAFVRPHSIARRATPRLAGGDGDEEPSLAARAAWVGAEVFGKVASAVRADDAPPPAGTTCDNVRRRASASRYRRGGSS